MDETPGFAPAPDAAECRGEPPIEDGWEPLPEPPPIPTRATYLQLLLRGLDARSAGNLTAFLAGLTIGEQPWSLSEVNRMLFLRHLAQRGRWSDSGLDHLEAPAVA